MSKKNTTNKLKCLCCERTKVSNVGNYYENNNPLFASDKVLVCKLCINKYIGESDSKDYVNRVISILSLLNRPFIHEQWVIRGEEWGKYVTQISSLSPYNEMTFVDSVFGESKNQRNSDIVVDENVDIDISSAILMWGNGYDSSDYYYLQNFYNDYSNSYATDTPVQINLYKNIAKVHLQAEKELMKGNTKAFKDLMDLSSKLHSDGNIKPIQNTGANDDRGLSTYGLWIKEIEREEPCEYFKNKPIYDDYDGIKKYWEKWFVRPLKNIFNLSKDFDVGDK